ncbi:hypothetical protein BH10PSE14_BH10PSE14_10270 [soil metagenome]
MPEKYYSLIELSFTGGVVLAFIVWQLISVNREIRRDKSRSEDGTGHPIGKHRLDDR